MEVLAQHKHMSVIQETNKYWLLNAEKKYEITQAQALNIVEEFSNEPITVQDFIPGRMIE